MSLAIPLAMLGAVVLAGIVVHGTWSARRVAPRLVSAPQIEPQLAEAAEPVLNDTTLPAAFDTSTAASTPAMTAARRHAPRLDALIDIIAPLTVESPLSGDLVLPHLPPTRRVGAKPF